MSTKSPVVSVVIPFVNHTSHIEVCWESLTLQTFHDFEVIFVDNGSTDGTLAKAQAIVEKHPGQVRIIREEKGGIPFARNAGIRVAKGRYISFLDIDDKFATDKFEVLVPLMDQNPGVAMAYGQTKRIYTASGKVTIQDTGIAKAGVNEPPFLAFDWASSFYRLPQTGATLLRTRFVIDSGGFPEHLLMGNDDAAFHIRLALHYKILYHPFVAVEYFRHEKSEGARLNNASSVHFRYFNTYAQGIEPLGRSYFDQTGDERLSGLAQRGMFVNLVDCGKADVTGITKADTEKFWNYYRLLLRTGILSTSLMKALYKATRRIPAAFFPDRYPLPQRASRES